MVDRMLGTVIHAPFDVRFEELDRPAIVEPTDAIIRLSATVSYTHLTLPTIYSV